MARPTDRQPSEFGRIVVRRRAGRRGRCKSRFRFGNAWRRKSSIASSDPSLRRLPQPKRPNSAIAFRARARAVAEARCAALRGDAVSRRRSPSTSKVCQPPRSRGHFLSALLTEVLELQHPVRSRRAVPSAIFVRNARHPPEKAIPSPAESRRSPGSYHRAAIKRPRSSARLSVIRRAWSAGRRARRSRPRPGAATARSAVPPLPARSGSLAARVRLEQPPGEGSASRSCRRVMLCAPRLPSSCCQVPAPGRCPARRSARSGCCRRPGRPRRTGAPW